ncbi:MAG: hypothetical protein KC468_27990 [Myxococcales bacterium]|nr:hypothetical protein [Myxococcales bacterium]
MSGSKRQLARVCAAFAIALASVTWGACIRVNEQHCANNDGDASCQTAGRPYCSLCGVEIDGCVAEPVIDPDCAMPEDLDDPGTTMASESESSTSSPTDADASVTDSGGDESTGNEPDESTTSAESSDSDSSDSDSTDSDSDSTDSDSDSDSTDSATTGGECLEEGELCALDPEGCCPGLTCTALLTCE